MLVGHTFSLGHCIVLAAHFHVLFDTRQITLRSLLLLHRPQLLLLTHLDHDRPLASKVRVVGPLVNVRMPVHAVEHRCQRRIEIFVDTKLALSFRLGKRFLKRSFAGLPDRGWLHDRQAWCGVGHDFERPLVDLLFNVFLGPKAAVVPILNFLLLWLDGRHFLFGRRSFNGFAFRRLRLVVVADLDIGHVLGELAHHALELDSALVVIPNLAVTLGGPARKVLSTGRPL